jgi:imidazolonepropionase-like amidohydrolase
MSSAGADRTLVIRHGTLIDGSGRPPVPNDALVVEGHRIKSVGPLPESLRSSGSRDDVAVIDASGQWIMPGLIDAHTHLSYGHPHLRGEGRGRGTTRPELGVLKAARSAQQVLRSGVTSISVPGGTWFTDVGVRDAIKLGVLEGPRVHCAGRMIITYGSIEDDEPAWVSARRTTRSACCATARPRWSPRYAGSASTA